MLQRTTTASMIFACLFSAAGYSSEATQDTPLRFMSFDAGSDKFPADPSGWTYRSPGQSGCGGWEPQQGALCSTENSRIHWYYNSYNTDHMGWLRYGSIYREPSLSVQGSALGLWATGGARLGPTSQVVEFSGSAVKSVEQLSVSLSQSISGSFGDVNLPGSIPIFYKNESPTAPIQKFSGMNRFTQWTWLPADPDRRSRQSKLTSPSGRPDKTIAWYPFIDDSRAGHYYHHITNRASGGWILTQWDAHPTHHNGGPYAENNAFTEGGRDSPLDGAGYFSRITAFSTVYHTAANSPSSYKVVTDSWDVFNQPFENEETIANLSIGFDPEFQDFDISFEDKYRCLLCSAQYELFFSESPITSDTLHLATKATHIQNFFTEDDNLNGIIVKPNPYYNQIWARFTLPSAALDKFKAGVALYIGLVDKTERGSISQTVDHELVDIPGSGQWRKQDLVKTIKYTYTPAPVVPVIQGLQNLSLSSGASGEFTIQSSVWNPGYKWVAETKDGVSISLSDPSSSSSVVRLSVSATGEFHVGIRLYDGSGNLMARHVTKVLSKKEDCRQTSQCKHYTLVEFSDKATTHELPYAQWHTILKDVYTNPVPQRGMGITVGSNGAYHYAGLKGESFSVGPRDVLTFTVQNASTRQIDLSPKISLTSVQRPFIEPAAWLSLTKKTLQPGDIVTFEIDASKLPQQTFSVININLPVDLQGVLLKNIGIFSELSLRCKTCPETLIDFYVDSTSHDMPYADWRTPLKDKYDGLVGDSGVGIVIGKNGTYNYQGIRGNSPLTTEASNVLLRWKNESSETMTFRPSISFNDPDRMFMGEVGEWTRLPEITIPPGEVLIQYAPIPAGEHYMVNVSVHHDQQKKISLTKILLD